MMMLDDGSVLKMYDVFLYGYATDDIFRHSQRRPIYAWMQMADFAMKAEGPGRFIVCKCRDLDPEHWISRVRTVAPSITQTEETARFLSTIAPALIYAMSETDHMMLKLRFG